MRSYPAYWVLHDLLLEPLPQQKSLELCEANEAETTDKCLKQARITHPSLMSTPRAKKELGWRRQAMLHRREATNCHGPLGIFFSANGCRNLRLNLNQQMETYQVQIIARIRGLIALP